MEQNRIRELIDALGLRPSEFAESLSITNQCLNGWLSRPITKGKALTINRFYPNVSVSWILSGEGDMFLPSSEVSLKAERQANDNVLARRIAYLERENERLLNIIEKYIMKSK